MERMPTENEEGNQGSKQLIQQRGLEGSNSQNSIAKTQSIG